MIESDELVGTRYGEVVKGTHHGYCFPERAGHHPEAAETALNKLTAMWRRTLG